MINNLSLKYRIAIVIFGLEFIMLAVVLSYSLTSYKTENENHEKEMAQISMDLLVEFSRTALLTGEYSFVQPHFENLVKDKGVQVIILRDKTGKTVASSSPGIILKADSIKYTEYTYWLERKIGNAAGDIGSLHMLMDNEREALLFKAILIRSAIIALVGMLIIAIIAISAGHLLTRKINRITDAARAFATGNTNAKTHLSGQNELDQLGHVFDEMTDSITNQKASLEQEVADRTLTLSRLNQELETFSYSISHDLRGPLRLIGGFCQAFEEDCSNSLDEQGKEYLARIKTNVNKMESLINDMLLLARVNRSEPKHEHCSINEIVGGLLHELKSHYPGHDVKFRIEHEMTLYADKQLLSILLMNALDNAWKYTSKSENPEVSVGMVEQKHETVYYVQDNGVGFDQQFADMVFTPFKRMHPDSKYPGTGLGLPIIRQVIQRHGGTVWLTTAPDQGTTLYFSFDK